MIKTFKCTKCLQEKDISCFNKRSNVKSGVTSHCKSCMKKSKKDFRRTISGVISTIYEGQCSHSKTRGHSRPTYTKEWLKNFIVNNKDFYNMYNKWVDSEYLRELKPSIDRLDDFKGYSEDNIRLVTWGENDRKGHNDCIMSIGTRGKRNKAVVKFSMDGKYICEYKSISEASRKTNAKRSAICRTCKGINRVAGNFKWKYKEDTI